MPYRAQALASDRFASYVIHSLPLRATSRLVVTTHGMGRGTACGDSFEARTTMHVQGWKLHDREGFQLSLLPVVQV